MMTIFWDIDLCTLAGLLAGHQGNSPYCVKNSMEFMHTVTTLWAGPQDILISFDVVSLFTKVPSDQALHLLADTLMRQP
jgi:hypothetical protein